MTCKGLTSFNFLLIFNLCSSLNGVLPLLPPLFLFKRLSNIDIRYFSCFNASSSERFFFKNNILSLDGLGTL